MSVKITCINKDNGNHFDPHMAITDLGWLNESTNEHGTCTRSEMIRFLETGGSAYVRDRYNNIAWLEVRERYGVKYVRTIPDQTTSDNLLSLAECRVYY